MVELSATLVPVLGRALLHFVWQGAAIGLVAVVALQCLRDARPQARYALSADGRDLTARLADAGGRALAAATAARSRDGALDLLAADALITLALLAAAERDPAALEQSARMLREVAG